MTKERFISSFKPSTITLIIGQKHNILFQLCVESVIYLKKDALFIDGSNSFDVYTILRMANKEKILTKIHVARAFTEYQMDAIINSLNSVIAKWNPAILCINNLSGLFLNDEELLKKTIENLRTITPKSGIITVIGEKEENKLISSKSDRIIRVNIENNKIRIIDNENVFEFIDMPHGQKSLFNFWRKNGKNYT